MRRWIAIFVGVMAVPACSGGDSAGTDATGSPTPPGSAGDASVSESGAPTADASLTESGTPSTDARPTESGTPSTDAAADARPSPDGSTVTRVTVVMAGDIAESGRTQYARTNAAHMASHAPSIAAVVLLGDNARYGGSGTLINYYNKYYKPASEANWGQFDAISFPQLGNHEYSSGDPQGHFDYFASRLSAIKVLPGYSGAADDKSKAWYSFDINGWHFVSLNSNCSDVSGGCGAGGAQELWLKSDLAAHPNMPIVAAWHAPRYACGGSHPSDTAYQAFWADLYDAKADFVFVGHDHYYQRWKALNKDNPNAKVDTANGLTEIVAGSYGVSPYTVCSPAEARIEKQSGGDAGMGVFYLTIGSDGSYSFEYELESDGSIFDSGGGKSHHAQ